MTNIGRIYKVTGHCVLKDYLFVRFRILVLYLMNLYTLMFALYWKIVAKVRRVSLSERKHVKFECFTESIQRKCLL